MELVAVEVARRWEKREEEVEILEIFEVRRVFTRCTAGRKIGAEQRGGEAGPTGVRLWRAFLGPASVLHHAELKVCQLLRRPIPATPPRYLRHETSWNSPKQMCAVLWLSFSVEERNWIVCCLSLYPL